jgi:hypothetical protein
VSLCVFRAPPLACHMHAALTAAVTKPKGCVDCVAEVGYSRYITYTAFHSSSTALACGRVVAGAFDPSLLRLSGLSHHLCLV